MLQMENIWTSADRFDTPTKKITDPIPVLYQSGYLTIKDYIMLSLIRYARKDVYDGLKRLIYFEGSTRFCVGSW